MMTYDECITELRRVVQLGSYACKGCGHEHNCAHEGCAILREALAQMEQLYKDVYGTCDCCTHSDTTIDEEPCASCFDVRNNYHPRNWQWRGVVEGDHGGVD